MSEGDQRGRVVRALRSLDAMAVENRVRPGTPDVEYIGGWVELKWLRRWPKHCDVWSASADGEPTQPVVHIDHFTPQQRVWLKTRWRKGGRAFLLLQANQRDWLLFDGETAAQAVGRVSRNELIARALVTWNRLNEEELRTWLTMDLPRLHQRKATLSFGAGTAKPSALQPDD